LLNLNVALCARAPEEDSSDDEEEERRHVSPAPKWGKLEIVPGFVDIPNLGVGLLEIVPGFSFTFNLPKYRMCGLSGSL
jgi:hypothetical protein